MQLMQNSPLTNGIQQNVPQHTGLDFSTMFGGLNSNMPSTSATNQDQYAAQLQQLQVNFIQILLGINNMRFYRIWVLRTERRIFRR